MICQVKSDLMGEQTILCGMLQTGTLEHRHTSNIMESLRFLLKDHCFGLRGAVLSFDKMVANGMEPGYATWWNWVPAATIQIRLHLCVGAEPWCASGLRHGRGQSTLNSVSFADLICGSQCFCLAVPSYKGNFPLDIPGSFSFIDSWEHTSLSTRCKVTPVLAH